jgi:hypothetical protein
VGVSGTHPTLTIGDQETKRPREQENRRTEPDYSTLRHQRSEPACPASSRCRCTPQQCDNGEQHRCGTKQAVENMQQLCFFLKRTCSQRGKETQGCVVLGNLTACCKYSWRSMWPNTYCASSPPPSSMAWARPCIKLQSPPCHNHHRLTASELHA